ncbi:39S ribosomal protein L52, mitochondrial [Uranotaenia lowii]|uniref:39S ribosomal protein L52, mitochondrial n=1 Tax=Uranotaenia lowii TaxID=190385 RepID=UPI002478757F|nr:39S ribosomal protein L52, mitochondrial [Uranotaenia lowii]
MRWITVPQKWFSAGGFSRNLTTGSWLMNKSPGFRNPNKCGPLTDLSDYSYTDGRITPLGANQTKRMIQQRNLAQKIVVMSSEMDFALQRYNHLKENQLNNKRNIVSQKLKPKGHLLLKN